MYGSNIPVLRSSLSRLGLGLEGCGSSCPGPGETETPSPAPASYGIQIVNEPISCLDKVILALKLPCLQFRPTSCSLALTHILFISTPLTLTFTSYSHLLGLLVSPPPKPETWINPQRRLMVCDIHNLNRMEKFDYCLFPESLVFLSLCEWTSSHLDSRTPP